MKKFDNRVVIITRETRLEKVLLSQNTVSQAKFYISRLGGDFDDYQVEHARYGASVQCVQRDMEVLGNIQLLDRRFLPNFIFSTNDIVVVIGQDGLVVNTLKYLDGQPVIGINPDADRWDGVLLPFRPKDAARIVTETVAGKRRQKEVCMARACIQNGQELFAVNDFFIGQKTHTSARYVMKYGDIKESQSSSGVIVSTGLGSTGWMKSVIAGASRINESMTGEKTDDAKIGLFSQKKKIYEKWASRELMFAVREPFPSKTTGTHLVFGKISPGETLCMESLMGENGVIFSDGIESDFIAFNSGAEVSISLADKCGRIVV